MTSPNEPIHPWKSEVSNGHCFPSGFGLTKREVFAMAAMQGFLAQESEDVGFLDIYQTAEGVETNRRGERPDYNKPEIPNKLLRSASQQRCLAAVQEADNLITALNVPQP